MKKEEKNENEKDYCFVNKMSNDMSNLLKQIASLTQPLYNYKDFYKYTMEPIESLSKSMLELTNVIFKYNNYSDIITKIAESNKKILTTFVEKNYEDIINSSYIKYLNKINIKKIDDIDENIEISEDDLQECLKTLENVSNDTKEIRENTKPKNIIVVILLFIMSGIFGGFFNKVGESVFELITNAYGQYIEINRMDNNEDSQKSFFEKFRVVNANELNVREEPGKDSRLVGKLYLNQCVEVIEKTKYWTKIKYESIEKGISIIGWVYSRYLSVFDNYTSSFIVDDK